MKRDSNKALLHALILGALGASVSIAAAQTAPVAPLAQAGQTQVIRGVTPSTAQPPRTTPAPAASETMAPAEIGAPLSLVIGKSTLIRLPGPIERISVGNPNVADFTLVSARELYILGKIFGSTNVIMWRKGGSATVVDVSVGLDVSTLEQQLRSVLPDEKGIRVQSAADSVVLSGTVSSALKVDQAVTLAEAFVRAYSRGLMMPATAGITTAAPGQAMPIGERLTTQISSGAGGAQAPRVVNLLRVTQQQQVLLEVKVAEINKTLLDQLGVGFSFSRQTDSGSWTYGIISDFLTRGAGQVLGIRANGNWIQVDGEKTDGLIKILAEPNIVAISGQQASFLAGGTVYIPVAQSTGGVGVGGFPVITLQAQDFGVGLKFTPTVLDGGRINLQVSPEVSEPSPVGISFTSATGSATQTLPTFAVRRAQTTVQLMDGQSLAIAGLIKNNVLEAIRRFPFLGEIPILGALFRSNQFRNERTELMFVITPRLIQPIAGDVAVPTDSFVPPNRAEFFLGGQLEGRGHPDVPPDRPRPASAPQAPAPSGTAQGGAPAAVGQPSAPAQGGYQLK